MVTSKFSFDAVQCLFSTCFAAVKNSKHCRSLKQQISFVSGWTSCVQDAVLFPDAGVAEKHVFFSVKILDAWCFDSQGNDMHWLACALYVACRKAIPTVSRGTAEGNYVSLTRILRCSDQR